MQEEWKRGDWSRFWLKREEFLKDLAINKLWRQKESDFPLPYEFQGLFEVGSVRSLFCSCVSLRSMHYGMESMHRC